MITSVIVAAGLALIFGIILLCSKRHTYQSVGKEIAEHLQSEDES